MCPERTGPRTKSAAHRIGLVPCGCNPGGEPAEKIHVECAWCFDKELNLNTRFIPVDMAIKWAHDHGMDIHDLPTPAEARSALADTEPPPDTEPK